MVWTWRFVKADGTEVVLGGTRGVLDSGVRGVVDW
jgi:hypothetical protein